MALACAANAFDGGVSLAQVGAVYLGASLLAAAAPTPGGLGAMEAALVAGFTAIGMDGAIAVATVLSYRLATYWLPILPGWISLPIHRASQLHLTLDRVRSTEPVVDLVDDEVGEALVPSSLGWTPSRACRLAGRSIDHRPIVAVPRSLSVSISAALNAAESSGVRDRYVLIHTSG